MAQPIIIVKENGLVIEVKFNGNPGELSREMLNHNHVVLRWPHNEMASVEECEVVFDKQLGDAAQFEIRLQPKQAPDQTAG